MLNKFIVTLLVVLMGCVSTTGRYTRTPTQMDDINSSVVALVAPDMSGELDTYCTGSFISRRSVLTANHCIRHVGIGGQVLISTYHRNPSPSYAYEQDAYVFDVVDVDIENDLALLQKADNLQRLPMHSYLEIAGEAPRQGENVIVVGHPSGLNWTLTAGVVSYSARPGWDESYEAAGVHRPMYIQHDASAFYGNSGGPLINYDNELAGVVVQKHLENNNIIMSAHTSVIHRFLRGKIL